jgi:hypothetical protein
MTDLINIDIRDLIDRIGKLNKKEKLHILNILKPHDKEYTQNTNGYFFNLANVSDEVIRKVLRCLQLIEKNRHLLQEMDARRESLLKYYKSLIEDKLKMSITDMRNNYINKISLKPCQSNFSLKIERKMKINRRIEISDASIDELMKEHMKGQKYVKDSVYHRLNSRIKTIRSGRKNISRKEDVEENINSNTTQVQLQSENDGGSENVEEDNFTEDFKDDNYEEIDEVSEHSSETESIQEEEQKTETETECFTDKLTFYKRLLNMKGFRFDDNKHCFLVTEPYIL